MAERVQLRRVAGYRRPAGAINVARPSEFGNPYRLARVPSCVATDGAHWHLVLLNDNTACYPSRYEAAERAVALYSEWLSSQWRLRRAAKRELTGRDLACWCPLDQPCHADVLLQIANEGVPA